MSPLRAPGLRSAAAWRWPGSLRLRLLGATLVSLVLALVGAQAWLGGLFRDHVLRQFDAGLVLQLDQLTARLAFDAQGQPVIDPRRLSDPRLDQPFSGLYWQLDQMSPDGRARLGVLRSRSLWDTQLALQPDPLADGQLHRHDSVGPQGHALRVVERSLRVPDQAPDRWRLMVAADTRAALAAADEFSGVLAASLAGLGVLLALAALAQVAVGLAPLQAMQQALHQVRTGRSTRLQGRFPTEVQPLIDDFNGVLDRHAELVARARTQAGNLAHALKTPLAVLANAAGPGLSRAPVVADAPAAVGAAAAAGLAGPGGPGDAGGVAAGAAARAVVGAVRGVAPAQPETVLAQLVAEQVQVAQRHIHWHLARARVAASLGLPGQRTPVQPVLAGLLRVVAKLHAGRGLAVSADTLPADAAFAGEEQDLQEMLGNLLDNACRSARGVVQVQVQVQPLSAQPPAPGAPTQAAAQRPPQAPGQTPAQWTQQQLQISVDDDGPGIAPEQRAAVLQRGVRLDESAPGSGLGLAIVVELAALYGGALTLHTSAAGGLSARLQLPAAAPQPGRLPAAA